MVYLLDPQEMGNRPPCTRCRIKPLYGIDPVPI